MLPKCEPPHQEGKNDSWLRAVQRDDRLSAALKKLAEG